MELRRDPSTQALSSSHQCVLEWHEYTIRNFENSCSAGTSFCYFHDKCVEANPCPRIVPSMFLECVSELWIYGVPMNSAVNFSIILIITTHQSHDQFWDFGWKRVSIEGSARKNIIPLPFSNKNNFCRIVHWIRRNFGLLRMSFLHAGALHLTLLHKVHFLSQWIFPKAFLTRGIVSWISLR